MPIKRLSVRYSQHPLFSVADSNAQVWKYMDLTKFASLLDTNALFFPRADSLSDAWEGTYTVDQVRQRPAAFGNGPLAQAMIDGLPAFHRALRLHTFVSCWHLNNVESAAMWKLYVSQNEGIAIQSTVERLTRSFQGNESAMFKVYVGKVRYLDYKSETFSQGNTLVPFLHKRLSFEHERELRAVIQAIPPGAGPLTDIEPLADGLLIDLDLRVLIERIYVAPTSELWFTTLVEHLARKYGIDVPIKHSNLARDPLF